MFQYFPEQAVAVATLPDGQVLLLSWSEQPVPGTFVAVDKDGRTRTRDAVAAGLRARFLADADSALAQGLLSAMDDEPDFDEEYAALHATGLFRPIDQTDRTPPVWIDPAISEDDKWYLAEGAARRLYSCKAADDLDWASTEMFQYLFVDLRLDAWFRFLETLWPQDAQGEEEPSGIDEADFPDRLVISNGNDVGPHGWAWGADGVLTVEMWAIGIADLEREVDADGGRRLLRLLAQDESARRAAESVVGNLSTPPAA